MPKILSVAFTDVLSKTRQLQLEQQGYSVCSIRDLSEIEALGKTEKLDLAVIGHGFPGPEKRRFALAVNQYFPGLPIL